MSVAERLGAGLIRSLVALPRPVQRRLAGRPRVIDGQELDPEVQLLLRLPDPGGDISDQTPADARLQRRRTAAAFRGRPFEVDRVEDLTLTGPGGAIGARLYVPVGSASPQPLLLFMHGGGWVTCDLDTHDNVCRFLAKEAGVRVLSIDYRLAPEHPFPAAVEDAVAAYVHVVENAADLGAVPDAIAVGGDSAGGNLALVVSQLAIAGGLPVPAFCLAIYPVTDLSAKRDSYRLFREGYLLTEESMDWFRAHYLPNDDAALDPRASPLLAEDLSGMPPTYVATAGFDPLRDEGEEYAERLRAAGVPVTLRRHSNIIHGFVNGVGTTHFGRAATAEAAVALKEGVRAGRRSPVR
jgi:acetyl esterase/lipase